MAPFDKHHRGYSSTIDRNVSDWAENALGDDVLLLESEQEAELPYYVEVAGDYSIPHATADHWGSGDEYVSGGPAPRRTSVRPPFHRKSY